MTKTANLFLDLPELNEKPWRDYFNNNFYNIDVAFGAVLGITNLKGPYQNSLEVVDGQRFYDKTTGAYYEAQSNFVTEALPTTFAQERVAFPARWLPFNDALVISAASNAAASAAAALASENAAAAVEANVSNDYVAKAGSVMTGALALPANGLSITSALSFLNNTARFTVVPCFFALRTNAVFNVTGVIPFGTQSLDVSACYDPAAFEFTATVDGVYAFYVSVQASLAVTTGNVTLQYRKNGVVIGSLFGAGANTTAAIVTTRIDAFYIADLAVGDTIDCQATFVGASSLVASQGCFGSVFLG